MSFGIPLPPRAGGFSILVRIDLLLGGRDPQLPAQPGRFQYPRADRLIVGAMQSPFPENSACMFQYPRADRLIVGAPGRRDGAGRLGVSVSSCGSTYCWGSRRSLARLVGCGFSILVRIDLLLGFRRLWQRGTLCGFQYPRADRLIVGGKQHGGYGWSDGTFQYPRADRLIVGARFSYQWPTSRSSFSILVRIDLLLGVIVSFC